MHFTSIDQHTLIPVINRSVVVPDIAYNKRLSIYDALSTIPGSKLKKVARQLFIELPVFDRQDGYPVDWFANLRSISA